MRTTRFFNILLASTTLGIAVPASATSKDIDGDGIANHIDPDVDNDGIRNAADRNVDGGIARSGPMMGPWVGDRKRNTADRNVDGDATANLLDADVDGDGVPNERDRDANGDGRTDLIDFTDDLGNGFFLTEGPEVTTLRSVVGAGIASQLKLDTAGQLKVAVISTTDPIGTWRYLTVDGKISLNGTWRYSNDSQTVSLAKYDGEDETRVYGQYIKGPFTIYSWQTGQDPHFDFIALTKDASGVEPPIAALDLYLAAFDDFQRSDFGNTVGYSGSLGEFTGADAFISLQRELMRITNEAD
jgi:hypothetical protein